MGNTTELQIVTDQSRAEFTEITLKGEPIIDFFSNLNITKKPQAILTFKTSSPYPHIRNSINQTLFELVSMWTLSC